MTDRDAPLRDRVVESAARLLRSEGAGAVTTRRVSDEAGVQAPTLYRLFGDKDGMLDAVAEHVMAGFVSAKRTAIAEATARDTDPLDDLLDGWRSQIDFGVQNPDLFRLLSDPARVSRSVAARSGRDALATRVRRLAAASRLRVPETRAVELIQAAGVGAVTVLLTVPEGERDAGLADAMLDAVLARILAPADAVETPGRNDPSIVAADDAGRDPIERVLPALLAVRAETPALPALSTGERAVMAEWLDRTIVSITG